LALLFLEKNGITVKQLLSSAKVVFIMDHANMAALARCLREKKNLRWSGINSPYGK
jgi:hypothetical protein